MKIRIVIQRSAPSERRTGYGDVIPTAPVRDIGTATLSSRRTSASIATSSKYSTEPHIRVMPSVIVVSPSSLASEPTYVPSPTLVVEV